MWWTNTLRTSAEDLGTLAENDPLTVPHRPRRGSCTVACATATSSMAVSLRNGFSSALDERRSWGWHHPRLECPVIEEHVSRLACVLGSVQQRAQQPYGLVYQHDRIDRWRLEQAGRNGLQSKHQRTQLLTCGRRVRFDSTLHLHHSCNLLLSPKIFHTAGVLVHVRQAATSHSK